MLIDLGEPAKSAAVWLSLLLAIGLVPQIQHGRQRGLGHETLPWSFLRLAVEELLWRIKVVA